MARPRTQDPVVSTTVCLPTSFLVRLQAISASRTNRGLSAKSVSKLVHEIIAAALPAYEASEGYLWNPVANRSGFAAPAQPSLPPDAFIPLPTALPVPQTFPLPPPPPQPPTYTPSDAPPLRDLLLAAQERRLGDAKDLPLESFFEDVPPSARPR